MSLSHASSCDIPMPSSKITCFGRTMRRSGSVALKLTLAQSSRNGSMCKPTSHQIQGDITPKTYASIGSPEHSVSNISKGRRLTLAVPIVRPSGRTSTTCSQMSTSTACGSDMILSVRTSAKLAPSLGDFEIPTLTNRFGLLESRHSLQSSQDLEKVTLDMDLE